MEEKSVKNDILEQPIGFLTKVMNMKFVHYLSELCAKRYGLEHRQMGILSICHKAPTTQTELSSYGDLDKNYARIYVDDLEAKGLITRVINPKNRREKLVTLTKKGEKLAKEGREMMKEAQNAILSPYLSDDEIRTLHEILLKFFIKMKENQIQTKEKR